MQGADARGGRKGRTQGADARGGCKGRMQGIVPRRMRPPYPEVGAWGLAPTHTFNVSLMYKEDNPIIGPVKQKIAFNMALFFKYL